MKHLISIGKILFFVCMVLITAELYLRISEHINLNPQIKERNDYAREVNARIYREWLDTTTPKDRFLPPFLVFSNKDIDKDIDNPDRLKQIFEETALPPSQSWQSYDFLQDKKRAALTTYSIHSNSLGFRGKEYSKEKPSDTYRIIVLGSYDAFGHGVNDDETYSAYLEEALNKNPSKKHFEVWNGGRHAGTAVIGLARMANEIFEYSPDLLILDYGTIDTLVFGDNVFPLAMRFPDSSPSLLLRKAIRPLVPIFSKSFLWNKSAHKYFKKKDVPKRIVQFRKTMRAMLSLARKNNVPVVLVGQLTAPEDTLRELVSNDVFLFTTKSAFSQHPPQYPSREEWRTGYWAKTWLGEMENQNWLSNLPEGGGFLFYPYFLNLLRLNALGQQVVGIELAEFISREVLKEKLVR